MNPLVSWRQCPPPLQQWHASYATRHWLHHFPFVLQLFLLQKQWIDEPPWAWSWLWWASSVLLIHYPITITWTFCFNGCLCFCLCLSFGCWLIFILGNPAGFSFAATFCRRSCTQCVKDGNTFFLGSLKRVASAFCIINWWEGFWLWACCSFIAAQTVCCWELPLNAPSFTYQTTEFFDHFIGYCILCNLFLQFCDWSIKCFLLELEWSLKGPKVKTIAKAFGCVI